MRKQVMDARAVDEVGYFADGLLKCTSWGLTESSIVLKPGDYITADGISVDVRIRPRVSRGKPMMALQRREYNVLVDPVRFVDVIVDPGIRLAITNDQGLPVAELNEPDPELVRLALARGSAGMTDENLFAVARSDGWIAVAIEPRANLLPNLRREQMFLVPIGGFIAAFIVGVVVWFSRKRLSPRAELETAVEKREFVVHYQPIIELHGGTCIGAEALVRWQRPDGTPVRPDLFIPLAEETGLIGAITEQVVAAVVADLGTLLVTERSLHVAINLSAADIEDGRILDVVSTAIGQRGIEPRQIWLEATERGFMNMDAARSTIVEARRRGFAVAIDDFGTGYSSLQYLQGLPLDALKIDKSFIDTIGRNTATSSVTPHIIDMAKTLGLAVVAEGVETEAQAEYLRAHKVDGGQGWLFAKPMPALEFIAYFRRNRDSVATPRVARAVA
jgi:sensor c-di-GMP phosphodiesterase-like protein